MASQATTQPESSLAAAAAESQLEEPISQMPDEDDLLARHVRPLSSPWLQNQMVNALRDKQAYRVTRERVVVVASPDEEFVVVSDGRHSAKCYCREEARAGDVLLLDEARAHKVDGCFAYVARRAVKDGTFQVEDFPDINADHSLTALERTTGTDLTRLYSAEKDVAPDFDLRGLLQRRSTIVNSRDDAELSLGIEEEDEEAEQDSGLESVEMRTAADRLRQPRPDTIQSDKALLVRQWSNDVATSQLDRDESTPGFLLSGGIVVEELSCTGWCGPSLKNKDLYSTPTNALVTEFR